MKRIILISLLALLGMTQAAAQDYEYVPFVREGVKWVYFYNYDWGNIFILPPEFAKGKHYFNLELKGDTLINGKTYKAMHKYSGATINWENDTVPVYLREEDKIVYGIIPDGRKYDICPVGNQIANTDFYNGEEFVLYDFADPVTYWKTNHNLNCPYTLPPFSFLSVDTVQLGDKYVKRYKLDMDQTIFQIDGVGIDAFFNGYTLYPYMVDWVQPKVEFLFSHMIEDGKIIYKGRFFNEAYVGDVNEDEDIDIQDVVFLIDFLLSSNGIYLDSYDVNLDGAVTITDVINLIDMLLAKDESNINLSDKSNNPTREDYDKPDVYYKNEIYRIIIDGNGTVDYYDVNIAASGSSETILSKRVNGNIASINVSALPLGTYDITILTPLDGIYEGTFTSY